VTPPPCFLSLITILLHRSKSSRTTASSYAESADQLKSIRQEVPQLVSSRVLCAASTRHRVCAHASCPQVMTSMLTPEFGRRSQISDFYNKLNETDPNARDRAKINHMAGGALEEPT